MVDHHPFRCYCTDYLDYVLRHTTDCLITGAAENSPQCWPTYYSVTGVLCIHKPVFAHLFSSFYSDTMKFRQLDWDVS